MYAMYLAYAPRICMPSCVLHPCQAVCLRDTWLVPLYFWQFAWLVPLYTWHPCLAGACIPGRLAGAPSVHLAVFQMSLSYLPGTASLLEELDKKLMVLLRDGRTLIGNVAKVSSRFSGFY